MSKVTTVDVYTITCLATGKVYVGAAKQSKVRWRNHKNELAKGIHINGYLQKAWKKYGADSFEFKVVETCPPK